MTISKTAIAAIAALSLLFGTAAAPNMAVAAKGEQAFAAEKKKSSKAKSSKSSKKDAKKSSKAKSSKSAKKSDAKKSSKKSKSAKKSSKSKKADAKKSSKSKKVVVHHRDRVVVRGSSSVAVPLVVIGSSTAYAAYGPGWCRALHKGRHWAPRVGWHAGQHVGRVRC